MPADHGWCARHVRTLVDRQIDRSLNYGRHHIESFLRSAKPYRVVLDLGAGHGDDLASAKRVHANAMLQAVEVYPPNVAELRGQNVEVHRLDIERDSLPMQDEGVDVVIMNQVLEHVKDVYWVLHEVTRVLAVGGKLIVGVPNLASLHNRVLLLLGLQPTCIQNDSAHVRGYTRRDLLSLLNGPFPGGYSLRGFGGSNFYPFPATVARFLAYVLPNMAWGIFMLLQKQKSYTKGYLEWPVRNSLETSFYLGPGSAHG